MRPEQIRKAIIIALSLLITVALGNRAFNWVRNAGVGSKSINSQEQNDHNNENNDNNNHVGKYDDIIKNLLIEQEKRLVQLEKDNVDLNRQLLEMKVPPEELSLREKLSFIYPYDEYRKFPAFIWQTWKFGLNDDRFGHEFKRGEEEWARLNPGFVHELFNDDTSNAIIRYLYKNIPDVINAYEMMPNVILKIDFFKYLILFAKGGVYADVDTLPLQPVPNWIPGNVDPNELGMIIGIESDPINNDWKRYYARRLQFGNWVIQAKPGHPILREMIAKVTEDTLLRKQQGNLKIADKNEKHDLSLDIMEWTGTGVWTDVVLTYFNDYVLSRIYTKVTWKDFRKMETPKLVGDVLVLPINSFAAGDDGAEIEEEAGAAAGGKAKARIVLPPNSVSGDETHPLAFVKHLHSRLYNV